jgi:hypothetical protein
MVTPQTLCTHRFIGQTQYTYSVVYYSVYGYTTDAMHTQIHWTDTIYCTYSVVYYSVYGYTTDAMHG